MSSLSQANRLFRGKSSPEKIDMTPMVDVTFLLLIFFMVTASFVMQTALTPPPGPQETAQKTPAPPPQPLQVMVNELGEFQLVRPDGEKRMTASRYELRKILISLPASCRQRARIIADPQSRHEKVMAALDVLVGLQVPVSITMRDIPPNSWLPFQ